MRLIHGDQTNRQVFQTLTKLFGFETFRTTIKEMIRPIQAVIQRYALFIETHAGIYRFGMNTSRLQVRHLVAHEGYQRCDDEA